MKGMQSANRRIFALIEKISWGMLGAKDALWYHKEEKEVRKNLKEGSKMGAVGIAPTAYSYTSGMEYQTLYKGQEATDKAIVRNPGESTVKAAGRESSPAECQTCANRKYQDGSDEMVSFKTPGHIDPGNAASVVMGHEQEHVANAYTKARENYGVVQRASVRLQTAICPECGRTYVSGGVTDTQIKYYNEDNPYQQDMKASDAVNKYRGANVDLAA